MIDYAGPTNDSLALPVNPTRKVRVVAPSALPGGYELQVEGKDSQTYVVTVPPGGVKDGEVFLAPMPDGYKMENLIDVPTGRWKDGLFDFCKFGSCHPHLCMAMWCREIAMGQVMQRMRLSWLGERTTGDRAMSTFRTVLILVICYLVFDNTLGLVVSANMIANGYYDYSSMSPIIPMARNVVAFCFTVWSILALCKTRRNVRDEFSIPEEQCSGCEDCVCATFCGCCTVAQIARHTGDFEQYPSFCCTETGLPDHAPPAAPMTV